MKRKYSLSAYETETRSDDSMLSSRSGDDKPITSTLTGRAKIPDATNSNDG